MVYMAKTTIPPSKISEVDVSIITRHNGKDKGNVFLPSTGARDIEASHFASHFNGAHGDAPAPRSFNSC